MALLDRARAGRAGVGDLERPRARTRLRRHLADRHLRSGNRHCSTGPPAIPAPITTATSARATTCTPLRWWRWIPRPASCKWHFQFTPHDLHDWDATETPMLVDAEFHGRAAQAAAAGQPQRLLLCARPGQRQVAAGRAVRQEADLGKRHRRGWPAHVLPGSGADGGRERRSALGGRRRPTGRPRPTARPPGCSI